MSTESIVAGAGLGFLATGFSPLGAFFGAQIGALVGAFDTPDIDMPSADGGVQQTSAYGLPIKKVYGQARIGGNVIWVGDIVETEVSSSAGGKGGGGTTVTSYQYSASFAVAICEAPIDSVQEIWVGGNLLWNGGGTENYVLEYADDPIGSADITIYRGFPDQQPDSTINDGCGYRDVAYAVFHNMNLENFGNMIPQLSFTIDAGNYEFGDTPTATGSNILYYDKLADHGDVLAYDYTNDFTVVATGTRIQCYRLKDGYKYFDHSIPFSVNSYSVRLEIIGTTETGFPVAFFASNGSSIFCAGNVYSFTAIGSVYFYEEIGSCKGVIQTALDRIIPQQLRFAGNNIIGLTKGTHMPDLIGETGLDYHVGQWDAACGNPPQCCNISGNLEYAFFNHIEFDVLSKTGRAMDFKGNHIFSLITYTCTDETNGTKTYNTWSVNNADFTELKRYTTDTFTYNNTVYWLELWAVNLLGSGARDSLYLKSESNTIQLSDGSTDQVKFGEKLLIVDIDNGKIGALSSDYNVAYAWDFDGVGSSQAINWSYGGFAPNFLSSFWVRLSPGGTQTAIMLFVDDFSATALTLSETTIKTVSSDNIGMVAKYILPSPTRWAAPWIYKINANIAAGARLQVKDVVTSILSRHEVPVSVYDTSGIKGEIDGYVIDKTMDARGAILPLSMGYNFYPVEDSGAIVFQHKTNTVTHTVQSEYVSLKGEELQYSDTPEYDLPAEVNVKYIDSAMDFNTNVQSVRRWDIASNASSDVTLPMTITSVEAAAMAELFMFQAAEQRRSIEFTAIGNNYLSIKPLDLVDVYNDENKYRVRVTSLDYDAPSVFKVKGYVEDLTIVTRDADNIILSEDRTLSVGSTAEGTITSADPTSDTGINASNNDPVDIDYTNATVLSIAEVAPIVLDIPNVFSNQNYGVIVGGYPATSGSFGSSSIQYSTDPSLFQNQASTVDGRSTVGRFTSVTDSGIVDVIDRSSSFTVELFSGSLTSITEAELFSTNQNLAAIGFEDNWEIIRFATATLSGANTYIITDLLRGRFATERYAGTHTSNAFFVLLRESEFGDFNTQSFASTTNLYFRDITGELTESITPDNNRVRPLPVTEIQSKAIPTGYRISWQLHYNDYILTSARDPSGLSISIKYYDTDDALLQTDTVSNVMTHDISAYPVGTTYFVVSVTDTGSLLESLPTTYTL